MMAIQTAFRTSTLPNAPMLLYLAKTMPLGCVLNLLFPSECPVCHRPSDQPETAPFCRDCWQTIKPYVGYRCNICGRPTESEHTGACYECLNDKPFYDKILYFGLFEGVLKEALHTLKYRPLKRLSKPLGDLLQELDLPSNNYLVIPVPLHRRRLLERGFNQSALIARHFARQRGLTFVPHTLKRRLHNKPQSLLNRSERVKNVRDAFEVVNTVDGRDIILVDDVVTTGATVNECSKTLKRHGAKSVYVVALARAFFK